LYPSSPFSLMVLDGPFAFFEIFLLAGLPPSPRFFFWAKLFFVRCFSLFFVLSWFFPYVKSVPTSVSATYFPFIHTGFLAVLLSARRSASRFSNNLIRVEGGTLLSRRFHPNNPFIPSPFPVESINGITHIRAIFSFRNLHLPVRNDSFFCRTCCCRCALWGFFPPTPTQSLRSPPFLW